MARKTVVGPLWSGNVSWAAGEGGVPGTLKFVQALNQNARTLTASASGAASYADTIMSPDLDGYEYVGLWMRATKTAHTVAIPWALNQVTFWGLFDREIAGPFGFFGGGIPLYGDPGTGWSVTINRGLMDSAPNNRPFENNAANGSVFTGMVNFAQNPSHGTIGPYRNVAVVLVLQPNVAIAGTNTFALEARFVMA